MDKLFFELLQVAIGNRTSLSITPTTDDWDNLYSYALQQTLLGVCFYGIQKLPKEQVVFLTLPLKMQWLAIVVKIQKQNELLNYRCVELQRILSKVDFRTYIMKGQGNAILYDEKLCFLRQSGDIDIYLEGGYKKVIDYVNRTFPTKDVNELEIHYHCFNDVEVEIHYKPFVMDSPKDKILQSFFKECEEANFANKFSIPKTEEHIIVPTLEFNLVHQLVHIHHHLFYEGIGLRQLMDYYFLLLKTGDSSTDSINRSKKVIHQLGLDRFSCALMYVLQVVFGIERNKMLWSPSKKDGIFLLNEIMRSGNFGQLNLQNKDIYQNKWKSFWYIHFKTFRYWRFDHWAWFWSPIYRIRGFAWRKVNGYK